MQVERMGVKFFLDSPAFELEQLIPVFHSWIRQQSIPGHLLIDVHNYSHVQMGPGILLVGHEGNFSWDLAENRPGLLYYRKQPLEGNLEQRLAQIFRTVLTAAWQLEKEPSIDKLRFGNREFLILANDRLLAPNTPETFQAFEPSLRPLLEQLLGGKPFQLTHRQNPKERFAVSVESDGAETMQGLLENLQTEYSLA